MRKNDYFDSVLDFCVSGKGELPIGASCSARGKSANSMAMRVKTGEKTMRHQVQQTMVRLSLAVAALSPLAGLGLLGVPVARAQSAQCSQKLQFRTLGVCPTGGRVTVAPTGAIKTGGSGCIAILGTPVPAQCKLSGYTASQSARVSITVGARTYVTAGVGNSMSVSHFNIGTPSAGAFKVFNPTDLGAAPYTFGIGARLKSGANQAQGTYSGQLTVHVTFF